MIINQFSIDKNGHIIQLDDILANNDQPQPTPFDPDVIGGRKYKTVTIGNQTWLAENLDFKFNGLIVGESGVSDSEPRANYYNDDEATYGVNGNKYGLIYNWTAVKYLEDHKGELIPGWHVPHEDEFLVLASTVGGYGVSGAKLKSTSGWSANNGDGSTEFSAFPAGVKNSNTFDSLGHRTDFWTTYYKSYSGKVSTIGFDFRSQRLSGTDYNTSWMCSVRLVKDSD